MIRIHVHNFALSRREIGSQQTITLSCALYLIKMRALLLRWRLEHRTRKAQQKYPCRQLPILPVLHKTHKVAFCLLFAYIRYRRQRKYEAVQTVHVCVPCSFAAFNCTIFVPAAHAHLNSLFSATGYHIIDEP